MSLDSLLTIVGILIAVYAILPRVRKLELQLKFNIISFCILFLALIAIIYLQFYQTSRVIGITPSLNLARWKITPENASFLIIFFTTLIFILFLKCRGLNRNNIDKFRKLIEEITREKRYSELATLLDNHLVNLDRIYNSKFFLMK